MAASPWNPTRYERFARERRQPFDELLAGIDPLQGRGRALDLGCGTGALTRDFHNRIHPASTLGVDRSETMLACSSKFSGAGLSFLQAELAGWEPEGHFERILSNAALQWIEGHEQLLRRISGWLSDDGQLAVQVPANHDTATHVVARMVAAEANFSQALGGYVRACPVLRPEDYAALIHRLGFRRQRVEMVVYPHLLDSREEVLSWVAGTLLTDYERRLDPEQFEAFKGRYRELLFRELPDRRPFFYPFKRILIWAWR